VTDVRYGGRVSSRMCCVLGEYREVFVQMQNINSESLNSTGQSKTACAAKCEKGCIPSLLSNAMTARNEVTELKKPSNHTHCLLDAAIQDDVLSN
jgi:hypothetical protein